jgi:putative oxidoreductase
MEALFGQAGSWGLLVLRIALGVVFIYHGYPKFFKVPPIGGAAGFAQFLRMMGIPAPLFFAWVVAVLEFWGGIALILGLATRWLGLLFAIDMLVAIIRAKAARGVRFMAMDTTGWEFDFVLLAGALALMLLGAGAYSLDALWGLRI